MLFDGFHVADGSSGGMFYNLDKGYVESAVSYGVGCLGYTRTAPYVEISQCPSPPLASNISITNFAANVPTYELLTTPLNTIVHQAAIGGAVSYPDATYTLSAPSSRTTPLQWDLFSIPASPADAVAQLSFSATSLSDISPGASTQVKVTASTTATSCGTFSRQFLIKDVTNGFQDLLTHRFEIGLKEFSVAPTTNFTASVISPPYKYKAKTFYTIKNPRPSPVTVVLGSPESWLSIGYTQFFSDGSGVYTPPRPGGVSVTLEAAGSIGDSVSFVVTSNDNAASLTPHVPHTATLTFSYASADAPCAVTSSQTRTFTLTTGNQTYSTVTNGGLDVPQPTTPGSFGTTVSSTLSIPDSFTISSIKLNVGFSILDLIRLNMYAQYLKVVLISPDGTQYTLWNQNTAPSPAYIQSESFTWLDGTRDGAEVLHIDDVLTPSPTGQKLSALVGKDAKGTWTLQLSSNLTSAPGLLTHWRLEMETNPALSPPPRCCTPSPCLCL